MSTAYRLVLEPDDNGTLLVTFADVPKAVTFGANTAPQVDRLLDLNHPSPLDRIETALAALGQHLDIRMSDAA